MKTDIVCGMEVDDNSKYHSTVGKKIYYFCSSSCKEKFDNNQIKYTR